MTGSTRRVFLVGSSAFALAACVAPAPSVKRSLQVREVRQLVGSMRSRDGAGVALRRALGHRGLDMLDPFLMLDEIRSRDQRDWIAGFPEHPHRGFETVSYLLGGAFEHRDSVGNQGRIDAGATQWMTAGRGILHEEMPKQEDGKELWGFQLWVNLPAKEKMTKPRYQELGASDIPEFDLDDAHVRLVAGHLDGRTGPVDGVFTRPLFADVNLAAGATFRHELPSTHASFVYVIEGALEIGAASRPARQGELAVLGDGDAIALRGGPQGGRALLLAALPLGEPVARRGPFVMNTRDELQQAFEDYRAGRLGREA